MPFSWDEARASIIAKKIQRNITFAKVGTNKDFKISHPDWVSQAQTKNFVDLKKKVKESVMKQQDLAIIRRLKLVGK